MSKTKRTVLAAVAVALVAAAGFLVPTIWLKPWSIDHFYARTFIRFALRHPMLLSQLRILEPMGLDFHSDELDDASVEFHLAEAAWTERQLAILRSYDRRRLEDQLSYDVLEWFLADAVASNRFLFHNYPVNQLFGAQSSLPDFMINTHQIRDREGAEDYLARLSGFEAFFDQILDGLRYRAARGIVPPRFVLSRVLTEMRAFLGHPPPENPLCDHFAREVGGLEGLSEGEREELLGRCQSTVEGTVYPSYRELIAFIEEQEATAGTEDGVWKLPDGAAFYVRMLRHHTTTDRNPEEVHRLGLAEVERLQGEMRILLEAEGYEADDLGRAVEELGQEPRFLFPDTDQGREQILERYQAIVDEISGRLDGIFHLRPEAGVTVKRIPEFKEATSPAAYYDAPPFDGSKPGTFYVNLRSVGEHPRWAMRTLAYHEAIPGHHFQVALAQEMEGVPFFRRVIPFTAYVEGWALYAEQLAAEEGFQEDPYDRLGYLQAQLLRAVRLVVDTGIHARRWSREEAIDYMLRNTGIAETDVVAEVERYIVSPGQACAYKVGQLRILELRERARRELGPRFDLRDFHDVVLGAGAVPLTILERLVEDWIAERSSAAA